MRTKTEREEMHDEVRAHDWGYMYSDDGAEYRRGQRSAARIHARIAQLGCPYSFEELRAWSMGLTIDKYSEPTAGVCRPLDGRGATILVSNLITRARAEEIDRWFGAH